MPTTIITDQARVALAHRECEQATAEIQEQLNARMEALLADPQASDKAAFEKLCAADPTLMELVLAQEVHKVWRDGVISDGCVATIEDDGQVRWTPPQFANQPKH